MLYFLSVFLLCLAPNLDNMAIGLAYGIRKISVPFRSNISIALFSGIATFLSSMLGSLLANYIPSFTGNIIGGSIVGLMGVYTIINEMYKKEKPTANTYPRDHSDKPYFENFRAVMNDPEIADSDYSGDISLKESILLGTALAANCLGTGFGAGMSGVNIYVLSTAVTLFSLITIFLGALVGRRYASRFSAEKATILSGLLLIVVGVYQMVL